MQAEALATLGLIWQRQSPEKALAALKQALALAESTGILGAAARALTNLGQVIAFNFGNIFAGREYNLRAAEIARKTIGIGASVFVLNDATLMSLWLGDFASAEITLPNLRQWVNETINPGVAALRLSLDEALLLRYQGESEEAAHHLRLCQMEMRQGDPISLGLADGYLAEVLLELNATHSKEAWRDEAEAALQEAMQSHFYTDVVWSRCMLSTLRARQGQLAEAHHWLAEAREKLGPPPHAFDDEHLAQAEARLAIAEDRWSDAIIAFEATAILQKQMGKRWYHAQTLREWAEAHLNLAKARQREPSQGSSDIERARALLQEALAEFEAMGVAKYAELVRERLRQLNG